jgi:anion-transporting  ArsA/GET3 family ATPase
VGKTSVACALAWSASRLGRRTLVVELDAVGAVAAAFESSDLVFEPTEVAPGCSAMAMDTEASLAEYLRLYVKIPVLGRLGPLARTFEFVAQAAPGVREILTIGKLCHEVRRAAFDLVVVDAPASGHVVELLTAPRVVHDLVRVGRRSMVGDQTRWMLDIVEDPDRTGVVVVTTPEELPVNETFEMVGRWQRETPVGVAAVIANRVLPEPFGQREEAVFGQLALPEHRHVVQAHLGSQVDIAIDATRWAVERRRLAARHLERLRQGLPDDLAPVLLPEIALRAGGRRLVTQLADHLHDELDVVPR